MADELPENDASLSEAMRLWHALDHQRQLDESGKYFPVGPSGICNTELRIIEQHMASALSASEARCERMSGALKSIGYHWVALSDSREIARAALSADAAEQSKEPGPLPEHVIGSLAHQWARDRAAAPMTPVATAGGEESEWCVECNQPAWSCQEDRCVRAANVRLASQQAELGELREKLRQR